MRFVSSDRGKSIMVDGRLSKYGDQVKVASPQWDAQEVVTVQVFWCEIPKEWATELQRRRGDQLNCQNF